MPGVAGGLGLADLVVEPRPRVSVIMPIRNEADFIGRALGAVLDQSYPADRLEVIVVDGASDDGTVAEVEELAAAHPDVEVAVVVNPDRIVPISMNLGLARATGDVIVRVDGHCVIEPGYLDACIETLARTGVECAGGPMRTIGVGAVAEAIATAQSSRFGVGGVAFRTAEEPGLVDTLAFGAYRREVFDRIGGFDPELVRNQDDELNLRLTRAGGRIWMDPSIRSSYFSRSGLRKLHRQYHQYGLFKVRVMQKHRTVPSARHLVPATFVAALGASLAGAAVLRKPWLAASVAGPYAVAITAASIGAARRDRTSAATVAAATAAMHMGYGTGFLAGAWRFRRLFGNDPGPVGPGAAPTDAPAPLLDLPGSR